MPSVLAQLACDVRVLRPISRQVFFPVPNVDSVLVGLERRADVGEVPPALRAFVQGAFAHRRKALARSVALAGVADRNAVRGRAGGAGRAGRRARGAACARAAAGAVGAGDGMTLLTALAPGKTNLCLFLGGMRADGLHELVSVIEPLSLADELTLEPLPSGALVAAAPGAGDMGCAAGDDEVVCAGVDGPNLAGEALAAFRAASGWEGPPLRLTIAKRVPVAAGMGGGSGDAAAALRLVAHAAGRDADDPLLARLAPAARSGRAVAARARTGARSAARARTCSRCHRCCSTGCSCCPRRTCSRRPTCSARPTGSGCRATPSELAARRCSLAGVAAALARGGCRRCSSTTSSRPPARCARRSTRRSRPRARPAPTTRSCPAPVRPSSASSTAPTARQLPRRPPRELRARFPGATGARPVDAAFAAVRGVWNDSASA